MKLQYFNRFINLVKLMTAEVMLEVFTPSTYKVLMEIAKNKKVEGVRELIRRTGLHPVTVSKAIKILKLLGIIDEKYESGKKVLILTEKGKKVVEKINELDQILRS